MSIKIKPQIAFVRSFIAKSHLVRHPHNRVTDGPIHMYSQSNANNDLDS